MSKVIAVAARLGTFSQFAQDDRVGGILNLEGGGNMAVTFETVRQMALALEKVEEGTSYGTAALKVYGELIARRREDLDSLVVRSDFEQRAELMAADPETYYITDHYLNYEWVLVRLGRVHPEAMRDLLRGAWRRSTAAASKKRGKQKS